MLATAVLGRKDNGHLKVFPEKKAVFQGSQCSLQTFLVRGCRKQAAGRADGEEALRANVFSEDFENRSME